MPVPLGKSRAQQGSIWEVLHAADANHQSHACADVHTLSHQLTVFLQTGARLYSQAISCPKDIMDVYIQLFEVR